MTTRIVPAAALLLFSIPASAQQLPASKDTPKQTLSTNPVTDLTGHVNVEFQRRVTPAMTLGISGGTYDYNLNLFGGPHEAEVLITALARYYPQRKAPAGLFIGMRAGVHRDTELLYDACGFFCDSGPIAKQRNTAPSVGGEIGYDWVSGRGHVGIGVGAMRMLGPHRFESPAFPTLRLNAGIAF